MTTKRYVDISRSLQNLEDADIHPENVEAVRDLINHSAAEGISDVQQQRIIQCFKSMLTKFAPEGFRLSDASESELKALVADLNRSDYAESTKHKYRASLKKFYKVENGGNHPDKVDFFSVHRNNKPTSVNRDDLFTKDELKEMFRSFGNTRDRALFMLFYESAARPGEILNRNIGDFTSNEKGDFIYLEGLKGTPDRTNQLVRAGRTVREWISQHPLGGELGDIDDPNAPLWVKTEQQACENCGDIPRQHSDSCSYAPDLRDRLSYQAFRKNFHQACERADIPDNKRRPYNLRHTRLTEVATFMGYEQLNKFAGWKPGSDRAKVYVHLNNDDVNKAIRDQYGLDSVEDEEQSVECPFCGSENESQHGECRQCGRPLSLKQEKQQEEKQNVLERLQELEEKGVLDRLDQLEQLE